MRARPYALAAILRLSACGKSESYLPDASVQATLDSGARPKVVLAVKAHLADGGVDAVEFEPSEMPDGGRSERARIGPTKDIELAGNLPLRNFRIRLFDETDRALSSDDLFEEADQGLNYRILLHEPLKPGHRYTLVVDAQSGAEILDSQGNAHPDQRLEFQVAGEREKPQRQKPAAKKRRRSERHTAG